MSPKEIEDYIESAKRMEAFRESYFSIPRSIQMPNSYEELIKLMEEYASIKLSEAKSQMRDKIVKELEEDIKEDDFILTDGYKYGVNTAISIVKEAMK
jgi:hypothetical protein